MDRALSFRPDAVIANGDHVYWDQETAFHKPNGAATRDRYREAAALFDEHQPADALVNSQALATVGERQIADLYGARLRSTPVWFMRDDHDYFDNDEVIDGTPTFPPSRFRAALTDKLQSMFWPELLAPQAPGSGSFGSLRWGSLFEALLYAVADTSAWTAADLSRRR